MTATISQMATRSLPVLVPNVDDQKWSCHSCGDCCRTLVGHLSVEERDRIMSQGWTEKLGTLPIVRAGGAWVLNKRNDGACVFLDEQQRCRIHAEYGEGAKPVACRIFPFSLRRTAKGWQTSLRFDCPSVTGSIGVPLARHRDWVNQLASELNEDAPIADQTLLARGLIAEPNEIEAIRRHIRRWINHPGELTSRRFTGLANVVASLYAARLDRVRNERFSDLLEILFETVAIESVDALSAPSSRQRGMLRQLVLAHTEHVTISQLRSFRGRLSQRLRQLNAARKMRKGRGTLPPIPGISMSATFEQIEAVSPATREALRINDLLRRYLIARLEGDAIFGPGYYGWPIVDGLAGLILAIACTGWLARCIAAGAGRDQLGFSDAATAIGIVDRAATRLPALGTWTERSRIRYLAAQDALPGLAWHLRLTE